MLTSVAVWSSVFLLEILLGANQGNTTSWLQFPKYLDSFQFPTNAIWTSGRLKICQTVVGGRGLDALWHLVKFHAWFNHRIEGKNLLTHQLSSQACGVNDPYERGPRGIQRCWEMMDASCKTHLIVKIPFYFPAYLSPGGRGTWLHSLQQRRAIRFWCLTKARINRRKRKSSRKEAFQTECLEKVVFIIISLYSLDSVFKEMREASFAWNT